MSENETETKKMLKELTEMYGVLLKEQESKKYFIYKKIILSKSRKQIQPYQRFLYSIKV